MKKNLYKGIFSVLAFGLPLAVNAQVVDFGGLAGRQNAAGQNAVASVAGRCPTSVTSLTLAVDWVLCFLQSLMPLLFTAALIYFLWGAVQFIQAEDKGRDEARNKVLYGIIGLFVMVSVWGLVAVLSGTFNLSNNIPSVPAFVR